MLLPTALVTEAACRGEGERAGGDGGRTGVRIRRTTEGLHAAADLRDRQRACGILNDAAKHLTLWRCCRQGSRSVCR